MIYVSPQVSVANSDDYPELAVAITAIVFAIGLPLLLVFGVLWMLVRAIGSRQRARYRLIELSLKQGMPLPDSFYKSEIKKVAAITELLEGTVKVYLSRARAKMATVLKEC